MHLSRRFVFAGSVTLVASALGCGGGGDGGGDGGTGPRLVPTTVRIAPATITTMRSLGQAVTLAASVLDQNGNAMTDVSPTWSTSNAGVLSVSGAQTGASARIAASGNGSAKVYATVVRQNGGSLRDSLTLGVQQEVAALELTPPAASVVIGNTTTLAVALKDAGGATVAAALAPAPTFRSTDNAKLTVSAQGVATGVSVGTAKVIAEVTVGGAALADTADVTVTAAPQVATSISIGPATLPLLTSVGATTPVTATVLDQNNVAIPGAAVTWSTSAPAIATLTSAGGLTNTVVAAGNGTATISATIAGLPAATRTVTVQQQITRLDLAPSAVLIGVNATNQLAASFRDAGGNPLTAGSAPTPTPTFRSTAAGVATVSPAGLVTGVAVGTANVIVEATVPGLGLIADTTVVTVQSAFPATALVSMNNLSFQPPTVHIAVGGTVTWSNNDNLPHNVTFDGSAPNAPGDITAFSTGTRAVTFSSAGTFDYQCTLHGGMTGKVVVH